MFQRHNTGMKLLLAVIAFAAIFSAHLSAQTTGAATLVGTVRDGTGAVIPNASVTATNVATSVSTETKTTQEGSYYLPYLNLGTYRVTIQAAGFTTYVREGILLRSGETPRVDVSMQVGEVTESVRVTGAAPLLETETAEASQILTEKTVRSLPVSQRRHTRMLYYFPNMSGFQAMGQSTRSLGYAMDGVSGKTPATDNLNVTTAAIQTTLDAVEEVKVTTSAINAEVGHAAGGQMSMVFKSGTNELHGSVEDRYIKDSFIHRSYLQQFPATNPFTFHDLSATTSGPIFKNRTFFLVGWAEHYEESGRVGVMSTVPSPEMYNGDFSFGGQGLPIYNPLTTRKDAAGNWVRDPFEGNMIPKSMFDPVVKNFLAQDPFYAPTTAGIMTRTGPTQNKIGEEPETISRMRWDVKVDHNFTPSHKIFGRYSHARHRADRDYHSNVIKWKEIDSTWSNIPIDHVNGVISDTLIISPTRFNEFRIGINRRAESLTPLTYNQGWAKKLGMPGVSELTFPFFDIGYDMAALGQNHQVGEDITLQNNFTQISGKHTLKAGYELIRTRFNATPEALPAGRYSFAGTDFPFRPNTGNTFASFLLGTVGSAVYTQESASWLPRWWRHAGYIQDTWKPVPSLTLNLGVRWQYETPYTTKYGQQSQFDPLATDPLTGKVGAITHAKGRLGKNDLNNFQPRLGLAWNFRNKWVFRSSFSILTQDLMVLSLNQNFLEYMGTVNFQAAPGDPRHVFRLSDGPPQINYPKRPDGSIPFVGTNYSQRSADWLDPNLRLPYIVNYTAGLQYEFAPNWLMELNYQASNGIGLQNWWDVNVIPLNISSDMNVLNQIYAAQQNYKPYPQFGQVRHFSNYGHNTYHSGTVRVERRYTAGLTLVSFYTYSKTLDEGGGDGQSSGITYYNRKLEKARSSSDLRHRSVTVLTYELPFGQGRQWMNQRGVLNHVLGGWNLAWTQTWQSGNPTTVSFSGGPNKYLPGAYRPHALVPIEKAVVGDAWEIGPNRFPTSAQNPYLKFDAFAYPAPFTAGSLGRNVFERPGINWQQFALSKQWSVTERLRFTLRADFYNLFPKKFPQFSSPNSTYNINSPATFGRFTSTQGQWANVGTSQSCLNLIFRVEF